jgi:ABC transport system ATP-binding/permease protein
VPIPGNPQGSKRSATQRAQIPFIEVSNNRDLNIQTYPLVKYVTTIGRDNSCEIVINFPFVSRSHLKIERSGDLFYIVHPAHVQTVNGLIYQGRHIQSSELLRKPLVHGDVFRIGDEHGTLVPLTFDDGSGQNTASDVHPIALGARELTIGRERDNTVELPHPQVSAHHARLEQVQGTYRILDLGSTNHVYVNGRRIPNQLLNVKDEIRIGPYKFIYTGSHTNSHSK